MAYTYTDTLYASSVLYYTPGRWSDTDNILGAPDGLVANMTYGYPGGSINVDFPNPSAAIAGNQVVRVRVRKVSTTHSTTMNISALDNGLYSTYIEFSIPLSNELQDIEVVFNADDLTISDWSNFGLQVSANNLAQFDSVTWLTNQTVSGEAEGSFTISGGDASGRIPITRYFWLPPEDGRGLSGEIDQKPGRWMTVTS